jgi:hypothetical protein
MRLSKHRRLTPAPECCTVAAGHQGMLSTVVGTVAVIPATLAILGRKHFPLPVTLILAHVAASGFVVAIAASDKFARSSTFLLGKVRV